jgi:CBS domain-containing protein
MMGQLRRVLTIDPDHGAASFGKRRLKPSIKEVIMHAPLLVSSLCQRKVVTAQDNITVKDAAELMRRHHVGSVVITQGAINKPIGILTDRDIAIVAVARDFDPLTMPISQIMSTQLHTIAATQPAISALKAMRKHGVRRLPVTGEFDELVGIISLDDLLNAYGAELALFAQAMRREQDVEQRVRV